MECRGRGAMTTWLRREGVVKRWNGGTVERWNGGTVERWNGGTVERWNGGTVERWNGGTVERPDRHPERSEGAASALAWRYRSSRPDRHQQLAADRHGLKRIGTETAWTALTSEFFL